MAVLPAQADLLVWLRADTGLYQTISAHTTPATADGDLVGTWADKSGNGRDVSPDVNANRPTLKLAIYGSKQILRFSGSGPHLRALNSAFTGITGAELFVVVKKTANSDTKAICNFYPTGLTNHHRFSDNHIYDGTFTSARVDVGIGGADFSTAFRVYNVISVSNEFTVNLDAIQVFTRASNTFVVDNAIGAMIGGTGGSTNSMGGDIAELVIYNRKLTTPERSDANAYFTDPSSWTAASSSWASVQKAGLQNLASGTTITVSFPGAVTAGNLIVVGVVQWSATGDVLTVSDNKGNTYASAGLRAAGPAGIAAIYWTVATTGGSSFSVTFSVTTAGSYLTLMIGEFSFGAGSTISVEGYSTGIGTVTTFDSGLITPVTTGDLIIGVVNCSGSSSPTPGPGFTIPAEWVYTSAAGEPGSMEYLLAASGPLNATMTYPGGASGSIAGAAFKATAVAGAPAGGASLLMGL